MYRKLFWFCLIGSYLSIIAPTRAQVKDTAAFHPKVSSFIIPAALIGYGAVSLAGNNVIRELDRTTKEELQEDHPLFASHVDDYLQFVPAVAVYGLNLAGIKGRHNLGDATGFFLVSEVIMNGTVHVLKTITNRERPDHSGFNSFPSGHTANAFATAEFLNQEYKDLSPWYGYAGYTVATATGIFRMYNNRHWLSDVVAGAGFGILSTKLAYIIYPKLKRLVVGKGNMNYNLMPTYQGNHFGFSLNGAF
ncbi:phosphatase PAP2 family protein [Pedobacter sp. JCM 36344]|uniref:phosphatase PAP2 family protein n=1 Tax=Pedobacter sp. JCM 36344 TaxID=3374280 RepID=UPI00397E6021